MTAAGLAAARAVAAAVPDPELPMLTLADLGVLRDVVIDGRRAVVVTITPTYSGCPASRRCATTCVRRLAAAGFADVEVRTVLAPPWTSDWITAAGRRKLSPSTASPRRPGRAPRSGPVPLTLHRARRQPVRCPRCGSADTDADLGVRRDRLQGAAPLHGLP